MKRFFEVIFYTTVCIGMAISTSSFTVISGIFENISGLGATITVLIAVVLCLIIASSVGKLATMFPSSPGIRTYIKKGLSEKWSVFFVFSYLIFIIMIGSVECYLFSSITYSVLGLSPYLTSFLLLGSLVLVNLYGFNIPKNVQIISTSTLVIALAFFGAFGMAKFNQKFPEFINEGLEVSNLSMIPIGLAMAIFLFVGFEWVTPLGFNREAYSRKIPMSMKSAILINGLMYLLLISAFAMAMPSESFLGNTTPQIQFFRELFGPAGHWIAFVISFMAIISTFNAGIMGAARIIYAISREGLLPNWFSKISINRGVPSNSIIAVGLSVMVVSTFVIYANFELVFAAVGSAIICFVYSVLLLSLIKIDNKVTSETAIGIQLLKKAQLVLVLILPLVGLLCLISIEEILLETVISFFLVATLSFFLMNWAIAKKETKKVNKKARKPQLVS